MQNHRHTDDVDARSFELLQNGNNNRNDGRSKAGGAGESHVHDDEEECHNSEYHERGGVGKVEGCYNHISKPRCSLRGEQCAAKRNADAKEYDGAPVDFVDDLLPLHDTDFWQH